MADLLRLTPIIYTTQEGTLKLSGVLFGRGNWIEKFARHVAKRAPAGPIEIGIGHAICVDDAKALEQHLHDLRPDIRKTRISGVSPAIGVHGGPGSLLVAVKPWVSAQDIPGSTD
jgi:fatty acid-binding protein DegV